MVLLNISASKGQPSEMTMNTLDLGISILRGGNVDVQMVRAAWPGRWTGALHGVTVEDRGAGSLGGGRGLVVQAGCVDGDRISST